MSGRGGVGLRTAGLALLSLIRADWLGMNAMDALINRKSSWDPERRAEGEEELKGPGCLASGA